jgi:hypothetical protein
LSWKEANAGRGGAAFSGVEACAELELCGDRAGSTGECGVSAVYTDDLWKLRAKGLVEKIPHSRRYRLCLIFLKLYDKIYAPLTSGILQPFEAHQHIPQEKITALDRRYTAVIQALDDLVEAIGLKAA